MLDTNDQILYEAVSMKCSNPYRQKENQILPKAGVGDGYRMTANRYKVSFGGDEAAFKLDCGDSFPTLNILNDTCEMGELYGP